jgi:hypothetical protein
VSEMSDLANLGVRRFRAQVLGIQSREDARIEKKIAVGSGRRIAYRDLARKGSRNWVQGSRDCEKRYPDSWRQCGP